MKKYIVTIYNSKLNNITTLELKLNDLTEVENAISNLYNGWATITAIIVTH